MFDVIGKRRWFYPHLAGDHDPGPDLHPADAVHRGGRPAVLHRLHRRHDWEIHFEDPNVTPDQVEAVFSRPGPRGDRRSRPVTASSPSRPSRSPASMPAARRPSPSPSASAPAASGLARRRQRECRAAHRERRPRARARARPPARRRPRRGSAAAVRLAGERRPAPSASPRVADRRHQDPDRRASSARSRPRSRASSDPSTSSAA